jgi:hypothetical protein
MKGGSSASTAVVDLVKTEAYEHLNTQFDNLVGGAKSKSQQKTSKSKTPKKTSTTSKTTKPKTIKAKPGKKDEKHEHKGGVCMICGGNLMKHMNDFDDKDLQSVFNKKGGAPSALYNIKYDISNAFTQPAYGDITSRALDAATMKQMSYESPSSLSPYEKYVQYGNVSGTPVMKFNYTGGKSKAGGKSNKSVEQKEGQKQSKTSKP